MAPTSPQPDQAIGTHKRARAMEKAKAQHLSRQLMMRLQYARLKVEHGWTKQNLNEVENLYFHHYRAKALGIKVPSNLTPAGASITSTPASITANLDLEQPSVPTLPISINPIQPSKNLQSLPSVSSNSSSTSVLAGQSLAPSAPPSRRPNTPVPPPPLSPKTQSLSAASSTASMTSTASVALDTNSSGLPAPLPSRVTFPQSSISSTSIPAPAPVNRKQRVTGVRAATAAATAKATATAPSNLTVAEMATQLEKKVGPVANGATNGKSPAGSTPVPLTYESFWSSLGNSAASTYAANGGTTAAVLMNNVPSLAQPPSPTPPKKKRRGVRT